MPFSFRFLILFVLDVAAAEANSIIGRAVMHALSR